MDKGMRSEFRKLLNSRRSISCRFVHQAYRLFRFATMRLGKKAAAGMLVNIRAPVAQMDQSGRFLNGKSRFDSGREHHFFQPNFHRIPSLKSDTAFDTILSF